MMHFCIYLDFWMFRINKQSVEVCSVWTSDVQFVVSTTRTRTEPVMNKKMTELSVSVSSR